MLLQLFIVAAQILFSPATPLEQRLLSTPSASALDEVRKELVKAQIIPEVIDSFDPIYSLSIVWPSTKSASLGNALLPKDVSDVPKAVVIETPGFGSGHLDLRHLSSSTSRNALETKKKSQFILAMTDPDAPSRDDPKWSEFCHWIKQDIGYRSPGVAAATAQDTSSDDLMSYRPPTPPEGTGFHRYVFLAFTPQNGTSNSLHLSKPKDRKRWGTGQVRHGVRDWAKENGLVPVGANFVYVQNEKQ